MRWRWRLASNRELLGTLPGLEARFAEILPLCAGLVPEEYSELVPELASRHSEFGGDLERLCAALVAEDAVASARLYEAIRGAGEQLDLESEPWEVLRGR